MSYEPKVQVVRYVGLDAWGRERWVIPDDRDPTPPGCPVAYLVTEAPMPGERVVAIGGGACTVEGLANPTVVLDDGGVEYARYLRPYDPDEALVERVAAVLMRADNDDTSYHDRARMAIDAIREADQ